MNEIKIDVSKLHPDDALELALHNDLMSEARNKIAKEISDNYDDLIFSLLIPYGITRENYKDHIDRITVVSAGDNTDHYMIDGEYRFSIIKETTLDITDIFKADVKYTVRVIEEFKNRKEGEI